MRTTALRVLLLVVVSAGPRLGMAAVDPLNYLECWTLNGGIDAGGTCLAINPPGEGGPWGGTILITGIPAGAGIVRAYLWYQLHDAVTPVLPGSPTLDGVPLTPVSVGEDGFSARIPGGHSAYFRADVTGIVRGNGSYELRNVPYALGVRRSEGATIVVVYQHDPAPAKRVVIYDGSDSVHWSDGPVEDALHLQLIHHFTASAGPVEADWLAVIGGGQVLGPGDVDPLQFNGTLLETLYPTELVLSGSACSRRSGEWDLGLYDVSTLVPSGSSVALVRLDSVPEFDWYTVGAYVLSVTVDNSDTESCVPLAGACCHSDGVTTSCVDDADPTACVLSGGTFQGAGSSCASTVCQVPTGACCKLGGSECEELTELTCEIEGGEYQGDWTDCVLITCPLSCITFTDSQLNCCETSSRQAGSGLCCDGVVGPPPNGPDCESIACDTFIGGHPDYECCETGFWNPVTRECCPDIHAPGCELGPVDECCATGACCLPDGSCVEVSAAECADLPGSSYRGDGTSCASTTCPTTGACCLDGFCFQETESTCEMTHCGTYRGDGTVCAPDGSCLSFGACCLEDSCEWVPESVCDFVSGSVYLGDGSHCPPHPCAGSCDH